MDERTAGETESEPTLIGDTVLPEAPPPALTIRFRAGSRAGTVVEWSQDSCIMGRAAECDLRFERGLDGFVSGRHLELERRADEWWLADLGSTNGTYVNGRRVDSALCLASGDSIDLGPPGSSGSVGFEVEFAGARPTTAPDETTFESSADEFEFRCADCGAVRKSRMDAVGRMARCSACGIEKPVPLPPVNPFARLQPRAIPSPPPQVTAPAVAKGFFSRMTNSLRNVRERREVREQLELLQGRIGGLRQATDSSAEEFGREAWKAQLPEALAAAPGARLQGLDNEREELRSNAAELDAELERGQVEERTDAAEALARIAPLREEAERTGTEVERSNEAIEAAKQALRGCLAQPLADLALVSRAALELAEVDDPANLEEPHERLRATAAALTNWSSRVGAGIEGLDEARATLAAAETALAAARAVDAAASTALQDALAQEDARARTARQRRTDLEGRRMELGRRLRDADTRARPLLIALGREVASAGGGASLAALPPVVAALTQEVRLEREIEGLRARFRLVGGE